MGKSSRKHTLTDLLHDYLNSDLIRQNKEHSDFSMK